MLFAGHYGDGRLSQPRTLEDMKTYARSLIAVNPVPDWIFGLMDMLHEVEDTVVCAFVRVRECFYACEQVSLSDP